VCNFNPTSLAQGGHTIVASETDLAGNTGTASLSFTYDHVLTVTGPTPRTASLPILAGSSSLTANTPVATFTASSGLPNDAYSFTLAGAGAGSFNMTANAGTATLSTGAQAVSGASGGQANLYALTVQAADITSGVTSTPTPMDIVVDGGSGDTINLAAGTGNLGIVASTPTFVYGGAGNDNLNASGMTGKVWMEGGAGGDTLTGGQGANDYLYASAADSTSSAMDVIANFKAATDIIDLTGLGLSLHFVGRISNSLAADSVGYSGTRGNTYVMVNTTGASEHLSSVNMKIDLKGAIAPSSNNILHV
jgi:Ca2+-binding RTX toxin-like protein